MRPLLAVLCVGLAGCYREPVSETRTDNPNINAEHLVTIDGCKVYRFYDGGYARYMTICPGGVEWHESCGKNCTRPVESETVAAPVSTAWPEEKP